MQHMGKIMQRLVLAGMLLTPAACVRPAALVPPAAAPVVASVPEIVIELTDDSQVMPETLPAGITRITATNTGKEWHAVIFRRLNEGVTPEQFATAFAESPFASLALTTQLGGPDVAPGASATSYHQFQPGAHALVDLSLIHISEPTRPY